MPAKSEKQKKSFGLVKGIQEGKRKGSAKAEEVAKSISPKATASFAKKKK